MVPKARMRQSRSYGSSLQNFRPPKSGIGCDICGRRIAVSVPDLSTGAKTPLKPFEKAIGVGGEKGGGNQDSQSTLSGIVGIRRLQIRPESRLAGRRTANQENRQPATLDERRGTGAICAGRLRFSQGDCSEAPPLGTISSLPP